MRARRLLALGTASAVLLLIPTASAPALSCKKFREQKGCRLPAPAGYASTGNAFTLTVGRSSSDANGRFDVPCTGGDAPPAEQEQEWPIDEKLSFPGRPKVGKTYTVESTTTNPPDSSGQAATWTWTGKLRIASAKKAVLTLGYTSAYGARTCNGSATKTLRRVKYL